MEFPAKLPISILGLWAVLASTFVGCDRQQVLLEYPFDGAQYSYFPLQLGKYRVYRVDSIVYDFGPGGGGVLDSNRVFVKEWMTDTLRDNQGNLLYAIERFERANETDPWIYKSTGTASRNKAQAIQMEDNFRFLKMVFPMSPRSKWDGNVWIDPNREIEIAGERIRPFANWSYEVDSMDVQATVGAFILDSTLLITEANDVNVIERRLSRARYAKHIGLVWREQWILDSQYCNQVPIPLDCETLPWEIKAEKGYILRQTLISYN